MITRSRLTALALLALWLLTATAAQALAQEPASGSAALAKELAQILDEKKLMTIAAKDGADPEAFTAAMYFAGSQLLVVGAKYDPEVLLKQKLDRKEYQDIYIDLNSAAKAGTRVFIEDLGADGLKASREEGKGFDSVELGGKRTVFDQKEADEAHVKAHADAEKTYMRLLQALIREARK